MLTLRAQIKALLHKGIYKSASILCSLLSSSSRVSSAAAASSRQLPEFEIENFVLSGDALFGLKEYRRALSAYCAAIERIPLLAQLPSSTSELPASSSGDVPTLVREADVRLKAALCHVELRDLSQAMQTLEAIPFSDRDVRICIELGKLYDKLGHSKAAQQLYLGALDKDPMAIEAILALLKFDAPLPSALITAYSTGPFADWLPALIEAHAHLNKHRHKQALQAFDSLLKPFYFPNNTHVLLQKAHLQLQLCDPEDARDTYTRVHELDPFNLDSMDMLAWILRTRARSTELNRLAQDMLRTSEFRPEGWVAAALYEDDKGDKMKALKYLDKAMALDSQHVGVHLVRGFIHLSMSSPALAIVAYGTAYQLDKRELSAFQGLVEAYLAMQQIKPALSAAKEALSLMPRNPKALTLVGLVLSHTNNARDTAKKVFSEAVSLDPSCIDAVMGLAKLYIVEKDYTTAIQLLEKHLIHHSKDFMHTKLANVYTLAGNINQALVHYHTALSITPNYLPAVNGIERLGQTMKGMDVVAGLPSVPLDNSLSDILSPAQVDPLSARLRSPTPPEIQSMAHDVEDAPSDEDRTRAGVTPGPDEIDVDDDDEEAQALGL